MATSRSNADHALGLCWGAWSELGVSGWGRTHSDWAIDPEPLMVFTSLIGSSDPRLRDEAMDWCIKNGRYVSMARLRHLLRDVAPDVRESWGVFAATVNAGAGLTWPGATGQQPAYQATNRSRLRPFSEPSLIALRLRAMFGIGARTEVLKFFLFHQGVTVAASSLADATLYTKRNVAEACEALVQAEILRKRVIANRFVYSLEEPGALSTFVGSVPPVTPDWSALLRVVVTILNTGDQPGDRNESALAVQVHQATRSMAADMDALGIRQPDWQRGVGILGQWFEWTSELMGRLASGVLEDPSLK